MRQTSWTCTLTLNFYVADELLCLVVDTRRSPGCLCTPLRELNWIIRRWCVPCPPRASLQYHRDPLIQPSTPWDGLLHRWTLSLSLPSPQYLDTSVPGVHHSLRYYSRVFRSTTLASLSFGDSGHGSCMRDVICFRIRVAARLVSNSPSVRTRTVIYAWTTFGTRYLDIGFDLRRDRIERPVHRRKPATISWNSM